MTTEEKNALAKEYELKNRMLPENVPAQIIIVQNAFEAGLTHRDKEVSDLVEALRGMRNIHIPPPSVTDTRSETPWMIRNRERYSTFIAEIDSLLSQYPVNTLPNG